MTSLCYLIIYKISQYYNICIQPAESFHLIPITRFFLRIQIYPLISIMQIRGVVYDVIMFINVYVIPK
jgi:hypothetical protein